MREFALMLFVYMVAVAVSWGAVAHVMDWTWLEAAGVWLFLVMLRLGPPVPKPAKDEPARKQADAFDRARW